MDSAQLTLDDYADSQAKRDAAIASVAAHADEDCPGWTKEARLHVRSYAESHFEFIGEQCAAAAYEAGLPKPHDPRAWGQVYRAEAKDGTIRKNGYATSVNRNCSPTVLWRSCHPNFSS